MSLPHYDACVLALARRRNKRPFEAEDAEDMLLHTKYSQDVACAKKSDDYYRRREDAAHLTRSRLKDGRNGRPGQEEEVPGEKPGVFHVSMPEHFVPKLFYYKEHFTDFVCTAASEGHARSMHPGGGSAFDYRAKEESRDQEWYDSGGIGKAPTYYLGDRNEWIHGAFVYVRRVSDYVPPEGQEPEYRIISSSFRSY